MSKKSEKVSMPMGIGGLVRYTDEEKEYIKMKPKHVTMLVIGIVVFEFT